MWTFFCLDSIAVECASVRRCVYVCVCVCLLFQLNLLLLFTTIPLPHVVVVAVCGLSIGPHAAYDDVNVY